MEMDEFNKIRQDLSDDIAKVIQNGTDSNFADLLMKAAIQGLIISPVDINSDFVPTPICGFLVYKNEVGVVQQNYIYPTDQHKT